MAKDASNKPAKVFRYRGISASVFLNPAESDDSNPWYKISIRRTYRQGDEFRSTHSFSRDDLPVVIVVAEQAYQYVLTAEAERSSEKSTDEPLEESSD